MGKKTGFLEYERRGNPAIAPLERIQNFNEFHPPHCVRHLPLKGKADRAAP